MKKKINSSFIAKFFAVIFFATLLRFYNLSGQSLWADEGNSVALARRSFAEIAQRTALDIHPPLYYWLLKLWITLFGDSEAGLRSLSAILGIGVVFSILLLGQRLFNRRVGLIAAMIAAISPLQIYYSQETRMYMLLALLSSLTILLAFLIFEAKPHKILFSLFYVLTVTAGLYTHYAYPLILIVVNVTAFIWFFQQQAHSRKPIHQPESPGELLTPKLPNSQTPKLPTQVVHWLLLQLIPLLLYLPWLPIAWRQLTTWPAEQQLASLLSRLNTISTTLLFGLSWPYNLGLLTTLGLGLLLLFGVILFTFSRAGKPALITLWLWFLLPVLLIIVIFSPAFLKFLLAAAPALALLLALVIDRLARFFRREWLAYLVSGALLMAVIGASAVSLYHYFTDAAYARDNYRDIVQFIKSVGDAQDAIVLNAEGQQDVFNYYYHRGGPAVVPVYPLPRERPLNEAATLAEMQAIVRQADKVYGVYWATRQADPKGLIEDWLDTELFKATDRWYGNVRLVSYASLQPDAELGFMPLDHQLGQEIHLTGYALSTSQIAPGDILQVALNWTTVDHLAVDYVVFLQLLDSNNHLVGQRDAQPRPATSQWPINEPIYDTHGIFIEPGTPPGKHRLVVGLYDPGTGQRLPVRGEKGTGTETEADFIELGEIEIIRPAIPLPSGAFEIQTPVETTLLGLSLLGYDLYKLGYRSTPERPLYPGDPVQLVAYWRKDRAGQNLKDQLSIQVVENNGKITDVSVTYPLAGVDYPVDKWQQGEIIRAQYEFFLSSLEPGVYRLVLAVENKVSKQQEKVVTPSFRIEQAN